MVTDKEGQEIKVDYAVLDENRISIVADTNYSGLLVEVEGQVAAGENPLVFLAENSLRFLTGLKNITVSIPCRRHHGHGLLTHTQCGGIQHGRHV